MYTNTSAAVRAAAFSFSAVSWDAASVTFTLLNEERQPEPFPGNLLPAKPFLLLLSVGNSVWLPLPPLSVEGQGRVGLGRTIMGKKDGFLPLVKSGEYFHCH